MSWIFIRLQVTCFERFQQTGEQQLKCRERGLNFTGNCQHEVNDEDASHKINVFISFFYCLIEIKA